MAKRRLTSKTERRLRQLISMLKMRRLDTSKIPDRPGEIRLFMNVRNESLRLRYTLDYYSSMGVDRFFVVDNNSTDDTVSLLLSRKNIHVFNTKESFPNKVYWMNLMLRRYGAGYWCVMVDADELLAYPYYEKVSLRELCAFLEQGGHNAFKCLLLDIYPDTRLSSVAYTSGSNPLLSAAYFDPVLYNQDFGGMRRRVFGFMPCLSKFPLIKFSRHMFLGSAKHTVEGGSVVDIRGVLFHFKWFKDFYAKVKEEIRRQEYWEKASDYKYYMRKLIQQPDLSLYCSESVRFIDSNQLVRLKVMKSSADLDALAVLR